MRKGTFIESEDAGAGDGGEASTGKKRARETGGVADGKPREKKKATVLAEVEDGGDGGSSGTVGDGGTAATTTKKTSGGDYSKKKEGDLWIHSIT